MRRLSVLAIFLSLFVSASSAQAKLSSKQKDELQGYITKFAETTDAEVKHAMFLVRGVVADKADRKTLLALESNEDPQVRLGAKLAAVLSGDKKAHPRVAKELIAQGADFGLLRRALAPLPDADELGVVEWILKNGKPEHARGVFEYLGTTQGKLFAKLLDALGSPEKKWRELAAKTVIERGREDALPTVERLLKAKDEKVRWDAIQVAVAFSKRPDTLADAKRLLSVAVNDASARNKERAARRLVELKDRAGAPVLMEVAKAAKTPAATASILGFLIENDVDPGASAVAGWLDSDNKTLKMRAYQVTAMSKDAKFVDKLLEMYGSTEFDDRLIAVQSLGYTRSAKASKPLTMSLFEARQDIRAAAADSLVVLARADTLDALKRSLQGERDKKIKLRVVDAIGAIGGKTGLQVLRFQVTNNDVELKARTVEAIRAMGLKEGAKALDILLRDRNTDVQWRAFLATLALDATAAKAHFATMFRNPPAGFLADIEALDDSRYKLVINHLLESGTGSPRDAAINAVKRAGTHDQTLYEIAMSSFADSGTRKDLVRFFGSRAKRKDLTVLETIARGKDPTLARLAAWMLTRHPSKGLEASYRGYLASKNEALQAIAAYGLATVWR